MVDARAQHDFRNRPQHRAGDTDAILIRHAAEAIATHPSTAERWRPVETRQALLQCCWGLLCHPTAKRLSHARARHTSPHGAGTSCRICLQWGISPCVWLPFEAYCGVGTHATMCLKRSASADLGPTLHVRWARMPFSRCGFLEGFRRRVACMPKMDRPAVGWHGHGSPAASGATGFRQLRGSARQACRQRAALGVVHVFPSAGVAGL